VTKPRLRGPVPNSRARHFSEVLFNTVADRPDDIAFQFLPDGEEEERSLTWSQLERRAVSIAAALSEIASPGDRVLLLYAPGLEFIEAFLACQLAGLIAVATYPPRVERAWQGQRLVAAIAENCRPAVVLTGGRFASTIQNLVKDLSELSCARWLNSDLVPETSKPNRTARASGNEISLLQYTSGSTGDPKGVVITHANLVHNEELMRLAFGHTEETEYAAGVCWLPPYHDMGLMGHILHGVYIGFPCAVIPPMGILQWPVRWLKTISKYRADASGGPNFIYELCSHRIAGELREGLDLSHWNIAGVGAEPVRAQTLDDFSRTYEPYGFRPTAFEPSYGLAEATLCVTASNPREAPVIREFHRNLGQGDDIRTGGSPAVEPQRLVGCGHSWLDQSLLIVDPETRRPCPGKVGEIWVSGPSVAAGYWERPTETAETFGQQLATGGDERFLRTGDLGFEDDGHLFVVGRLKDLIIIRGKNFHPHDLELAVQSIHPAFRLDCGAAFGIESSGEEQLVIVQEIDRRSRGLVADDLKALVRKAILQNFDLRPHAVVFLRNGTLPKTTSGKVQRRETRRRYLAGELVVWDSGK
jgi:acyl-CoA synthetase (AMP-forming)/AMP-acid ligase II